MWKEGGSLLLLLQPPEGGEWRQVHLSQYNDFVGIPPYWRHGGVAFGDVPLVFDAYSRVDHFRDNVHALSEEEQPEELKYFKKCWQASR